MEYYSFKKQIKSTRDIIDAIKIHQNESNRERLKKNLDPILFEVLEFQTELNKRQLTRKFFKIKNVSKFYCFAGFFENGELNLSQKVITYCEKSTNIVEDKSSKDKKFFITKSIDKAFKPRTFNKSFFNKNMKWIEKKLQNSNFEVQNIHDIETEFNYIDDTQQIDLENRNEKPEYCRISRNHCSVNNQCTITCTYQANEIFRNLNGCTGKKVKEELFKHGHPKTRIIKHKQRNDKQARSELLDHYKHFHFKSFK